MPVTWVNIGRGWAETKCLDCSAPILKAPDDADFFHYIHPARGEKIKEPLGIVCARCAGERSKRIKAKGKRK